MKVIYCLVGLLLLPSCVYYGVKGNFDMTNQNQKSACSTGTTKEKKLCRINLKRLKESIQAQKNK